MYSRNFRPIKNVGGLDLLKPSSENGVFTWFTVSSHIQKQMSITIWSFWNVKPNMLLFILTAPSMICSQKWPLGIQVDYWNIFFKCEFSILLYTRSLYYLDPTQFTKSIQGTDLSVMYILTHIVELSRFCIQRENKRYSPKEGKYERSVLLSRSDPIYKID